ncbi:MAG: MerR family DNA-binding transcriptional regulator [Actinobacteria bacterium]|nr:MerR family DNA-binding transcriptional regulator [Actinomycetota bacterium]
MTDHRSIGEVLDLLKGDFPDVTVSKIRFLESQGLIAPERTPSGYRKFYEPDVERLRWILLQQRDHFLPLKVIKSRLAQIEEEEAVSTVEPPPRARGGADLSSGDGKALGALPGDHALDQVIGEDEEGAGETALTREELARATGLDEKLLAELEGYGLLPPPRVTGEDALYDEQALVIARLARGFLRHGVEARHLRMYKTFAEREATFVGQLVTPLLLQKNPDARQQARETVGDLARLGGGMRAALLRLALRSAFGE